MSTPAFVKITQRGGGFRYCVVRLQDDRERQLWGRAALVPLVRDDEGDPVEYTDPKEAFKVAEEYNHGLDEDDVAAARWDDRQACWEVTEWRCSGSKRDPDREDFHADG